MKTLPVPVCLGVGDTVSHRVNALHQPFPLSDLLFSPEPSSFLLLIVSVSVVGAFRRILNIQSWPDLLMYIH